MYLTRFAQYSGRETLTSVFVEKQLLFFFFLSAQLFDFGEVTEPLCLRFIKYEMKLMTSTS